MVLDQLLLPSFVGLGVFIILYFVQLRSKRANAVDVGWALLIGLFGIFYASQGDGDFSRRILLAALTGYWSFRLSFYLWRTRILRESGEDARYRKLRNRWGNQAPRNFLGIYLLNSVLTLVLSAPFLIVAENSARFGSLWDFLGLSIWIVSIAGESLADQQLHQFKRDGANKGKTCQVGLWKYSRHPNYFFEWLHWFTYVLLAIPHQSWPFTLSSPVIMYVLLTRITGIPAAEESSLASRGEEYRAYQKRTSAFFPWFNREGT